MPGNIFEDSAFPFQITSFDLIFFFWFFSPTQSDVCHKQWTRLLHVIWWIVFHPNITYRVKTGLSKYQISITKPCTPTDVALNVCWRWLCVNWWWLIALAMYKLGQIATGFVRAGIAQWLERRTRDWKVAGSNPCWNGGRIFFSRVDFLCWLLFRYPFHPRVTTVARKKSRSFCQKCRCQVTAKHAVIKTLRMWILLNRASALVTTCP